MIRNEILSNFGGGGAATIPDSARTIKQTVADQTARYALTVDDVQQGDLVYQTDTAATYIVVDETALGSAAGYHLLPAPLSTPVSVANGGTGATTAAGARTALSIPDPARLGVTGSGFELKDTSGFRTLNVQPASETLIYCNETVALFSTLNETRIGYLGTSAPIRANETQLAFFGRAPVSRSTGWTVPGTYTSRKTFSSAATVTLQQLADVVATLIATLGHTSGLGLIQN